jgi:rubredoxin
MFVAVRSYDNYIPANMMLQRLENEGIKAYLQDEHTVTIDPILTNAIGGIKLMVYKDQLERAMQLISSFEQAYNQAVVCPQCQATNMHFVSQPNNATNWLTAIVTWLFGNYALSFKKVYKCSNCGYESESMPA